MFARYAIEIEADEAGFHAVVTDRLSDSVEWITDSYGTVDQAEAEAKRFLVRQNAKIA